MMLSIPSHDQMFMIGADTSRVGIDVTPYTRWSMARKRSKRRRIAIYAHARLSSHHSEPYQGAVTIREERLAITKD
ncbi:hypothetical protein BHE74_00046188 [Ensete ventricosum]|nr:hypothetical protein GW17_00053925 [Ensete ventricosum]RWW47789.1 hypothetical protein BHE74_00046188 [Ensete ventricosum]